MKKRAQKILQYIVKNDGISIKQVKKEFNISKRTFYYDILQINQKIKKIGFVKNINHKFYYIGDIEKINLILGDFENFKTFENAIDNNDKFLDLEYRKIYILNKILNNEFFTIEELSNIMSLSKNTIVYTINEIKIYLEKYNLKLKYNKKYIVEGSEFAIRELFLILMEENVLNFKSISKKVIEFNNISKLNLTDYSLIYLTKFIDFINKRIELNKEIQHYIYYSDAKHFNFFENCKILFKQTPNKYEQSYICAYISTLSSLDNEYLNDKDKKNDLEYYVDKLIYKFEIKTAINIENKFEFKNNIIRHLMSSYNRIKFKFPINNPILNDIKISHKFLYKIVKSIIHNENDFPIFKGIREEEIGFIVVYFGGYLNIENNIFKTNKILLVCPNGLMVSKNLEIQLYKYIPNIEIVGSTSITKLKTLNIYYDYIVTTIDIPNIKNLIVVSPLLTKSDISLLIKKLSNKKENYRYVDVDSIIEIIKNNAIIKNEEKLKIELFKIIYNINEMEVHQPMLRELLNEKRVNKIKKVNNWEEAIEIASRPLIEDNSIEELYVKNIIKNIKEHGPYIVLADKFALPHASTKEGVNKLAMSLLVVENDVDLLGKPVNIFLLLATINNTIHLKALASISEILYEEENINKIISGTKEEILELINN